MASSHIRSGLGPFVTGSAARTAPSARRSAPLRRNATLAHLLGKLSVVSGLLLQEFEGYPSELRWCGLFMGGQLRRRVALRQRACRHGRPFVPCAKEGSINEVECGWSIL